MSHQPRELLREFYDQALLSPELLCLSCGNTDWTGARARCSARKRQDCLLFVSDMVGRLAPPPRPPRPSRAPVSEGRRTPASGPESG